jgi:hypothetical protein
LPSALQACSFVWLHRMLPGAQSPTQPFSSQTAEHKALAFHDPLSLHVETMLPSHFIAPGLQMPVQAPLVQR